MLGIQKEPFVRIPFGHSETPVNTELLKLREKGLIQPLEGNFQQAEETTWYQLTAKGHALAKTYSKKSSN